MIKNCPMRHENGNCIPAGGFCTANKNICEALHNAYRMGKAQLSSKSTTSDLISRQAVINAIENTNAKMSMPEWDEITNAVMSLPTVQPEPSIPLSWVEKYIEWLRSLDNEFANLAAAHISVMVKKWRDEQDETD